MLWILKCIQFLLQKGSQIVNNLLLYYVHLRSNSVVLVSYINSKIPKHNGMIANVIEKCQVKK